jgi:hypothetical protein
MSDSASQVNELRLLEQKRLTAGLAPEEEARRAALSGAVGTPAPTRGFDVKAAAAQVRALLDPASAPLATFAARVPDVRLPAPGTPPAPAVADPVLPSAGALDLELGAPGAAWDDEAVAVAAPVYDAAAPVYDAAAYGLDPNDPNDAAWAAWYAEQGWDPATAYAYALQLSAQGGGVDPDDPNAVHADPGTDPLGTAAAVQDVGLGEASFPVFGPPGCEPEAVPELSSEAALELHSEVVPELSSEAALESPSEAMPELPCEVAPELSSEVALDLPPMELGALDVPIAEAVPLDALEPEPDYAADPGLTFEPEAARTEKGDPPFPEVTWAELAVPANDQPVDFTVFDAEPDIGHAKEEERGAETTALWELPTGSQPQLPALDLSAGEPSRSGGSAFSVPGLPGDESDGLGGVAAPVGEAPLEGELIELLDEDIIQVAEEVVDVATPASSDPLELLAPVEAALPQGEAPLAAGGLPAGSAMNSVDTPEVLAPLSPESSLAFEALPEAEPPARVLEHTSLAPADEAADELAPMTAPEEERAEIPVPTSYVRGTHRVVIHTADGQVKRGTVSDLALDAGEVLLTCQTGGAAESVPVEHVKAIFFMLSAGESPPQPEGKKVRVTFRDGRQVAGYSVDYAPERIGFFMVPADARTHTARIWVYRTAVRQVSVS